MRHELAAQPTDPVRVCETAVLSLAAEAAARGVALSFAFDGPLPGALLLDEAHLRRTVLDLTAAALAETRGGELTLTAAYGRGALHLEADHGEEECLRLHIPAAAAPNEIHTDETSLEGLKVLVVDDSSVNRALARTLLTRLGVEVSEAEDGPSGLERAATAPFDAILMDIRMPGLSGHRALAALRTAAGPNRDTPVLAFTANTGPEERLARGLDRFDGIVLKPVAPLQMQRGIAAVTRCALVDLARAASA